MNTNDLNKAVAEAKRFIKVAKSCEEIHKASMDLSRALADLRHPYRKGAK